MAKRKDDGGTLPVAEFIRTSGKRVIGYDNGSPESRHAWDEIVRAKSEGRLEHKTIREVMIYMQQHWGWTIGKSGLHDLLRKHLHERGCK